MMLIDEDVRKQSCKMGIYRNFVRERKRGEMKWIEKCYAFDYLKWDDGGNEESNCGVSFRN